MRAPVMRRWENAAALAATVLAAAALLPLPPYPRLLCAGVAIVMLLVLLGMRLRAHAAGPEEPGASSAWSRLERLRSPRGRRRR
jgi:hypothetical protein